MSFFFVFFYCPTTTLAGSNTTTAQAEEIVRTGWSFVRCGRRRGERGLDREKFATTNLEECSHQFPNQRVGGRSLFSFLPLCFSYH
eukprot:scaffold2324_cov116-Cylindrotheca_fusiformis.AAC.7